MSWWLVDPERAIREKGEIADLQLGADWFEEVRWGIEEDLQFCATLKLRVGDKLVSLKLSYPSHFPDVPASIRPTRNVRLSGHQWGAGGELCLEYRPDNWRPEFTGADMIRSAYRLLSGELDEAAPAVASAHNLSLGQEVRNRAYRFLSDSPVLGAMANVAVGQVLEANICQVDFGDTHVSQLTLLQSGDEIIAEDSPFIVTSCRNISALAIRAPDGCSLDKLNSAADFDAFCASFTEPPLNSERLYKSFSHVLVSDGSQARLLIAFEGGDDGEPAIFPYTNIPISSVEVRNPTDYALLADATIAVVGCGSIGSKVATSLARAGVGSFLLIDHDLFEVGNVDRNALDRRAVGVGKANALKQVLKEINPSIHVSVRQVALGGQESSGSTASVVEALAKSDLIVDATADASCFNLCGSVSRKTETAMVWAQVYGGGIGGLVARSRPGIDPPPHDARAQINQFIADLGVPWKEGGGDEGRYDSDAGGEAPLIADDADVSVVAAHLARFAVDWLVSPENSAFPNSAYLIGLKRAWVFKQPFEVWPIDYISCGTWGMQGAVGDHSEKLKEFILSILPESADQDGN